MYIPYNQELLLASDQGTLEELQSLFTGVGDLDRMLGGVSVIDAKEDVASARRMVSTIILLKTFLRRLPPLVDALEKLLPAAAAAGAAGGEQQMEEDDDDAERGTSSTDALLRALIAAFSPPCFAELGARVDEVIAESTVHERGARKRRLQVGGMCLGRMMLVVAHGILIYHINYTHAPHAHRSALRSTRASTASSMWRARRSCRAWRTSTSWPRATPRCAEFP